MAGKIVSSQASRASKRPCELRPSRCRQGAEGGRGLHRARRTGCSGRPAVHGFTHFGRGWQNKTTLAATDSVDKCDTSVGIRTFNFDPVKGFSLNGQSMKLKGVCLHHDAGTLGAGVPIQVWERRLKLLKDGGCNAIRCSHNPPAPEFLDLCDRMGFLVMDEAFDEWTRGKHKWIVGHNVGQPGTDGYHSDFDRWADRDIRDMVLRDRNHPSIILWSIGNEIDYQNDPYPPNSAELPPIAERLIKDVKAVDTTRPVTAACASPTTNLFKKLLDVEGYNYMERLYAEDHAAHPNRVIYGSENSHMPTAWKAVSDNDYIAGQFLWTGIDYLGEAGIWPSHASNAGLLNLAGFPKDQYYLRKSLWTDAPMVYLTTSRPGRGRFRQGPTARSVWCYTNCDNVELFHDGKLLGSKPPPAEHAITWPVEFTSGVLKAVGTKGRQQVTFELKKAGAAAKLVLHPDVHKLAADGRDVAQIEVDVTDKDGTRVPDNANVISCDITGPARIIGIENGNTFNPEDYVKTRRTAFQGRLMIYVQSLQDAGRCKAYGIVDRLGRSHDHAAGPTVTRSLCGACSSIKHFIQGNDNMTLNKWNYLIAAVLAFTSAAIRADDKPAKPIVAVDRSYMDLSVSPCKDFYTYANGAFDKVPIPGEYPAYGVNQEINERNYAILKEILESSAKTGGRKGSVVQRVGDFFASGMDEATIDREGLRPLKPWSDRIAAIDNVKSLVTTIAAVAGPRAECRLPLRHPDRRQGHDQNDRRLQPGGLGLPERDYYFREGKEAEETRAGLRGSTSRRTLELAGDKPAECESVGRGDHGFRDEAGQDLANARRSPGSRKELQ